MESVFGGFIKKVSLLGLAGLILYTFALLSQDIIGKDLLPKLSEESTVELLKLAMGGLFILIILVVLMHFVKIMFPSKVEAVKPKEVKNKNKKSVSLWIYPLVLLLGFILCFVLITIFRPDFTKSIQSDYSVDNFIEIDNEVWDIRSTSRIKVSKSENNLTFRSLANGIYYRYLSLDNVKGYSGEYVETSLEGYASDGGFWGVSFGNNSEEYVLLLREKDSIFLGKKDKTGSIITLVNWSENFNLSDTNIIELERSGNKMNVLINDVIFAPIENLTFIRKFSYVIEKSELKIKSLRLK